MRLAFVSPLPPLPTGIADYAADLLAILAPDHDVEVFHDQSEVDATLLPPSLLSRPAAELAARHRERPFDLAVHQMGNARAHDFQYDLVARVPGLLVLHDLVLHHARAARFLESEEVRAWRGDPGSVAARERARPALDAWRAELEYAYPGRGDRLFAAHLGTVGELLPYAYPLFRIPVEASRAVAVHNAFMADAIRAEVEGTEVTRVPMPAAAVRVERPAVAALRRRLGLAETDVVVGVFGLLTPEKRPETVARAVARAAETEDRLRLLLVGPTPDRDGLEAALGRAGVLRRTVLTGRVPLEDLPAHMEAADVVAHLRYPTARETSASLARVLAQGRPAIISDLGHQSEIPADAVVRVDVADEAEGLARALVRLARDPGERSRLGAAAAAHAGRTSSPSAVRGAWAAALEWARALPDPPARDWPRHWPRPGSS